MRDGDVSLHTRASVHALRFLRRLVDDGLMSPDVIGYEWNRSPAPSRSAAERLA